MKSRYCFKIRRGHVNILFFFFTFARIFMLRFDIIVTLVVSTASARLQIMLNSILILTISSDIFEQLIFSY